MSPREVLKKHWGYDDFRPLQLDIIQSVLDGNDTLGLMPTGGGKSLTFQVPALMLEHLTIVVTPLISLMKDQVDNLRARHIPATYIHSGLTSGERNLAMARCRLGKVKILYVSPEKLQSDGFLEELRYMKLSMLVVDEAHCISQWGHDFRPSYLKIPKVRELFADIPVLALTATATPEVREDIVGSLRLRTPRIFSLSFKRENISLILRHTEDKTGQLLRAVKAIKGSQIVYVRSRKRARELSQFLEGHGVSSSYYHAGLLPEEKSERQNLWKDGRFQVMVATNAFGMGIDKSDVRAVIHYDIPTSLEEYYQEVGRAGRDGLHAWALALVSVPDKSILTRRFNEAFPPRDFIKDIYQKACVFMGVAMGDGYNHTYDFNFSLFCTRHNLSVAVARNALEILSQSGVIEFAEDFRSSARIIMTVRKEELYNLQLDETADKVLNRVLRLYTGIFSDYVHINEAVIAEATGLTETTVYETLLKLGREHVLHYVPRRMTPYIYFPTSREESEHLIIPRAVYEVRKEQMRSRIEAVGAYMFGTTDCRSSSLLRYFGEGNTCECGRCDVCRAKNVSPAKADETGRLRKSVEYLCRRGSTMDYILDQFEASEREKVVALLRSMLDNRELRADKEGVLRLNYK